MDLALVRTANGLVGATEADRELVRFNNKFYVDAITGCWVWTGSKLPSGYGRFRPNGSGMDLAHRFSYRRFKGDIPESHAIDHLCRNTSCCNPEHLEAVTHAENTKRSRPFFKISSTETHCVKGHPWGEKNKRLTKRGSYSCRQCGNESEQRRRDQIKSGKGV